MKRDDALTLIKALMERPHLVEDARQAFAEKYPGTPKEMIDTATFHVYVDGFDAGLEWLASIELFLRDPKRGISYGATWDLLHHLYNWQQFEALMPIAKCGITELLQDIKGQLAESNLNGAKEMVDDLIERIDGNLSAPDF